MHIDLLTTCRKFVWRNYRIILDVQDRSPERATDHGIPIHPPQNFAIFWTCWLVIPFVFHVLGDEGVVDTCRSKTKSRENAEPSSDATPALQMSREKVSSSTREKTQRVTATAKQMKIVSDCSYHASYLYMVSHVSFTLREYLTLKRKTQKKNRSFFHHGCWDFHVRLPQRLPH